jgi:hypothetical protein
LAISDLFAKESDIDRLITPDVMKRPALVPVFSFEADDLAVCVTAVS